MIAEVVSATRLYVGNLPRNVTTQQLEDWCSKKHTGKLIEVKVKNGYGFLEYPNAIDASEAVPAMHGHDFEGERLTIQFARGPRGHQHEQHPRPRRTLFRMQFRNLSPGTSWQDLKDFARSEGQEVVYSEIIRNQEGCGFAEYETLEDVHAAFDKLNGKDFKGLAVECNIDIQEERADDRGDRGDRGFDRVHRPRWRSRSPGYYRRDFNSGPPDDYRYGRRGGPPRNYSPRRDRDYGRRSPPRDYYRDNRPPPHPRYDDGRNGRDSPRGPVSDPYPPSRAYNDPYAAPPAPPPPPRGPPPSRYDEPYSNNGPYNGGGGRPPFEGEPRNGYDAGPRGRRSPPGPPPRRYENDGGYNRPRDW